ncbi:MAG: hypothetical protein JO149_05140 [Gammaproteobacteria bacterium]|nr:hypothetical protein [Gammaproteobacteria bacterium]
MPISINFLKKLLFILIVLTILTSRFAKAEPSPPLPELTTYKEIHEILQNKGKEVFTLADFFQAGDDCYNNKLQSITFYKDVEKKKVVDELIFFNDQYNHCIASYLPVFFDASKGKIPTKQCFITPEVYKKLLTPWHLDAIKLYDQTGQQNQVFLEFAQQARECLQKVSIDTLLAGIKSSLQLNPKPNQKK